MEGGGCLMYKREGREGCSVEKENEVLKVSWLTCSSNT